MNRDIGADLHLCGRMLVLGRHIDLRWRAKGRSVCRLESPRFLKAFKMITGLKVILEVLNISLNFHELLLHFMQSIIHRVCLDVPLFLEVKDTVF